MDLGWLDLWFSSFTKVSHKDLNFPGKAWLYCDGLSLLNQANWEFITKEWGTFVNVEAQDPGEDYVVNPMICIYTYQVKKIKETLKVSVEKASFWIVIREILRRFNVFSPLNLVHEEKCGMIEDSRDIKSLDDQFKVDKEHSSMNHINHSSNTESFKESNLKKDVATYSEGEEHSQIKVKEETQGFQ